MRPLPELVEGSPSFTVMVPPQGCVIRDRAARITYHVSRSDRIVIPLET